MMISVGTLCFALATHYVADFIVQTEWQAQNKSSNINALLRHVATYGLCFTPFLFILLNGVLFVLSNVLLHFITDFFTSRASTAVHKSGDTRTFFQFIGFDQLIHQVTLVLLLVQFG